MTKLKILLLCEQPLPSKGRAGRPNYSVKYLAKWGHEITVICPKSKEGDDGLANYEYIDIEFKQFSIINRLRILRAFKNKLKKILREEKFDIIRTINIIPTYSAIKIERKIKVYSELTDFLSDHYAMFDLPFKRIVLPILNRFELEIAKSVDFANVETDSGRRNWVKLGLEEKKLAAIPNGVDINHFDPLRTKPEFIRFKYSLNSEEILLYHGDIGFHDNLHNVIKSLKIIKNIKFMIVGDGPKRYLSLLKSIADKEGVKDRIIFTGWINYEDLPNYIAAADLCIAPFLNKTRQSDSNFHTKIREYLSMGKTIIATKTSGLYSILGNLLIYLNDPEDENEIAEKIKLGLQSKNDKIHAMRRIAEKLDWANIIKQDERFMEAIVNNEALDAREFDLKLNESP